MSSPATASLYDRWSTPDGLAQIRIHKQILPRCVMEDAGILLGRIDYADVPIITIEELARVTLPASNDASWAETRLEEIAKLVDPWRPERSKRQYAVGYFRHLGPNERPASDAGRLLASTLFPNSPSVSVHLEAGPAESFRAHAVVYNNGEAESRSFLIPLRINSPDPASEAELPAVPAGDWASQFRRSEQGSLRAHPLILSALALVVVSGAAGWGLLQPSRAPIEVRDRVERSGGDRLGLRLDRRGESFQLSWDWQSPAIQAGQIGMLTIWEGTTPRVLTLQQAQLRSGSIVYSSGAPDVTFEFEVIDPEKHVTTESIRAITGGASQAAPANPPRSEWASSLMKPFTSAPARSNPPVHENTTAPPQPVAAPSAEIRTVTPAPSPVKPPQAAHEPAPVLDEAPKILASAAAPPASSLPTVVPNGPKLPEPRPGTDAAPQSTLNPPVGDTQSRVASDFVLPVAVVSPKPVLPDLAKALLRTVSGRVVVKMKIDRSGRVYQVEPMQAYGPVSRMLTDCSISAAQRWTFRPARIKGQPVPSEMVVTFDFPASLKPAP